jgi:hypothetical protein
MRCYRTHRIKSNEAEALHKPIAENRFKINKPLFTERQKKRRVLIVVEERYVVVLEESEKTKELNFISAFPVDPCNN